MSRVPPPPRPPPPVCARSVVRDASCGLLIQHLPHSEQHLRSWPFHEGPSNLSTPPHADTHTHAAPRADITPHRQFLSKTQAPTLGNHPEPVQPPGHEIHTPGKQLCRVEGAGVCEMGKKMRGDLKMQKGTIRNVPEGGAVWGGGVDWGACVLRDGTEEGLNGH